jgi:hypothetical protein
MENNLKIVITALLVLCIILGGFMVMLNIKEKKCQINPLIYGAEGLAGDNITISCRCDVFGGGMPRNYRFWFDQYGIYESDPFAILPEDSLNDVQWERHQEYP